MCIEVYVELNDNNLIYESIHGQCGDMFAYDTLAEAVINRRPVFDEITEINIPVLILAGDEDKATPPNKSERIHKQIRSSKLAYVKNAGHSSCLEEPEQVNAAIASFPKDITAEDLSIGSNRSEL